MAGTAAGEEAHTLLLDMSGDLLAKIMFEGDLTNYNTNYLSTISRARDRHALYCTCRTVRENPCINSRITSLRLEVFEFNMDGSEAKPPLQYLACSLLTFPRHATLRDLLICKVGCGDQERERAEDSGWGFAGDGPFFLGVWEGLVSNPKAKTVVSSLRTCTLEGWLFEGDDLDRVESAVQAACPSLVRKPMLSDSSQLENKSLT